jgi:hypothetical protein
MYTSFSHLPFINIQSAARMIACHHSTLGAQGQA